MTLWFLMLMLCSAAAVAISYPLIRRYEARDSGAEGAAVYQDQIKEVDRDVTAGTIAEPEAKVAKAEIERRLNAAVKDQVAARPLANGWKLIALAASAGFVILGGINLYAVIGNPSLPSTVPAQKAAVPPAQQAQSSDIAQGSTATGNQVDVMIAKLQEKLKADPNNAEEWRMLGWSLFNTQRYQESADAYGKALAIDPNNIDYKSALAESTVQAAQGVVTPKAQDLIAAVLAKEPKDLRARFYDALGHEQSGDQQGAFDRWSALLADAPADAGWRDDVKQRLGTIGKALNKDVSGLLNAAAPTAPQAAGTEKNAMVAGMIAKLAQKLDANPKDRDGWAMMIRSLTVTGDKKGADEALAKALDIFKDDQATQDGLKQIAAQAGGKAPVTGADTSVANSAKVPPLSAGSAAPQISADQQAAVQAMPAQDQQAMIQGMVQKLADRLKDNPKDFDGWTRLMRAYMVLNATDKAKMAYADALKVFEGDQGSTDKLKAAASQFGIN
jgi:cytochrome c-type biogenesis protein CcmH